MAGPTVGGVTTTTSTFSSDSINPASVGGASPTETEIVEEISNTPTPDSSSSSESESESESESDSDITELDICSYDSEYEEASSEEEGDVVVQPFQDDVSPNSSTHNGNAAVVGPTEDGPVGVLLALKDPSVLKCCICTFPLNLPVYQCENGHIACASCCVNWNKCSLCRLEIGHDRCWAIEKLIKSIKSRCCYMNYGCMAIFSYSKRRDHEKSCIFEPCRCPHIYCEFEGMYKQLYDHFGSQHHSMEFLFNSTFDIRLHKDDEYAFFRERNEKILFVLHFIPSATGILVVLYYAAPSSLKCGFKYEISTTCGSVRRIASAKKTQAHIPSIPLKTYFLKKYRFILMDHVTCDFLALKITIWNQQGLLGVGSSGTG